MQLDLFEHSQQVVLRNAVIDAIKRRDALAGNAAVAALAAAYADDLLLPDMEILCHRMQADPLPSALSMTDAARLLQDAEGRLEPAVRRLLGLAADAWLSPFWLDLARALAGFPFDSRAENLHAAPLCMRGGDWQAAVAAIETIPSWRRQPLPLEWMIHTRFRIDGLEAVWHLIAEFAWMAPQRARSLSSRLADPRLARLLRRFDTEFEDSDAESGFAWFPAWVLSDDGCVADKMRLAQQCSATAPERCARLVMALLALECQGRHAEVIENRRRLRETSGTLFAAYMKKR